MNRIELTLSRWTIQVKSPCVATVLGRSSERSGFAAPLAGVEYTVGAMAVLSSLTFALALSMYGTAAVMFFLSVARPRPGSGRGSSADLDRPAKPAVVNRFAPILLGIGAVLHLAYITMASFVLHVCPVHSVHFILSVLALVAIGGYFVARRRFRVDALGVLVSPLGLAFLLSTFFLARPEPTESPSAVFTMAHVLANLIGIALFVLAGAAATLYLVQEKRLKKRRLAKIGALPPLDTLDRAVHRFLIAGFPLLTVGIITGTFWARQLEFGTTNEILRIVFGYTTWLLIAGVLLLRAAAGWRGRRAAYGTIAGLSFAMAVVIIYVVRPMADVAG